MKIIFDDERQMEKFAGGTGLGGCPQDYGFESIHICGDCGRCWLAAIEHEVLPGKGKGEDYVRKTD